MTTIQDITNCINCLSNYSKKSGVYFSIDKGSVMVHFESTEVPNELSIPKSILTELSVLKSFIDSFEISKKITFWINKDEVEIGHKYKNGYSNETYFVGLENLEKFIQRAVNQEIFQNSLIAIGFYNKHNK